MKFSISEINSTLTNETLQIAYFNEQKYSNKSALIIEDSKTICRILQDYLRDLGISDICICHSGREGSIIYNDLKKLGKTPTIFLDDDLSDINSIDFATAILDLTPEIKIILCTSDDENNPLVKGMIDIGIFAVLRKPIRFGNLREIVKIIKDESARDQKHTRDLDIQILSLLKSTDRTSLSTIANYCGMKSIDILSYMDKLIVNKKVIQLDDLKETVCNRCDNSQITQLFHCPTCNSSNFRKGILYEHFSCGNITPSETYKEDICPKCHKIIKILGVDYRQMEEYYICNDCGDQFTQLPYDFLCRHCGNQFKLETAKWISNPTYKI